MAQIATKVNLEFYMNFGIIIKYNYSEIFSQEYIRRALLE